MGDCLIVPYADFGLNIGMKKTKKISESINNEGNLEIGWETVIDEIYFTGKDDCKVKVIDRGIFAILLSMQTEEEVLETESHIITKYLPHPNKIQFAQNIPVILTRAFSVGEINWLHRCRDNNYPISHDELLRSLEEGVKNELFEIASFITPMSEK